MDLADTQRAYSGAATGQRLGFGRRPALLVIDLYRGLTDPASPVGFPMDSVVFATAELLAAARGAGIPVVHTTVRYKADLSDGGLFVEKVPGLAALAEDTGWSEIDDRVKPTAGESVLVKRFQSAFFGTSLLADLAAAEVDTLLVAGCCTSGCVRHTVFDSMAHGLRTVVVRECVAGRVAWLHEANLFDMDNLNADVVPLSAALIYLAGLPQAGPVRGDL